jgi:type IV pilus assembly protein PilM
MKLPLPRFGPKTSNLLGIDVDTSAVRLVELAHTSAGYQLQTCAQVPLTLETNTRSLDWQYPSVVVGLQQALQQRQNNTCQVAIALPQSAALFKTVELDRTLTTHEITAQVQQHAQQYFNYPLAELMWDFEILPTPARHAALQQIRWVAARRQEVQMRTEVLTKLGLDVVAVEVEAFSLQRLVSMQCEKYGNAAVLHFNDTGVLLVVLSENLAQNNDSNCRLGCAFQPNKPKQQIHYMRFEEYRQDDTEAAAALRAWQIFQNSEAAIAINTILLSGKHITPELLLAVQASCDIDVSRLEPAAGIDIRNIDPTLVSTEFAISMGLAMRGAA